MAQHRRLLALGRTSDNVERDHRGRGLGGRLVAAAAEQLDDLGVRRTLLSTYDAHAVCAAHGFTPLPERWMVRVVHRELADEVG